MRHKYRMIVDAEFDDITQLTEHIESYMQKALDALTKARANDPELVASMMMQPSIDFAGMMNCDHVVGYCRFEHVNAYNEGETH